LLNFAFVSLQLRQRFTLVGKVPQTPESHNLVTATGSEPVRFIVHGNCYKGRWVLNLNHLAGIEVPLSHLLVASAEDNILVSRAAAVCDVIVASFRSSIFFCCPPLYERPLVNIKDTNQSLSW